MKIEFPQTYAAGQNAGQLALARLAPDGNVGAWLGWLCEVIDGFDKTSPLPVEQQAAFKAGVLDTVKKRLGAQVAVAKFLSEAERSNAKGDALLSASPCI